MVTHPPSFLSSSFKILYFPVSEKESLVSFVFDLDVKAAAPSSASGNANTLSLALVRRVGPLDMTTALAGQLLVCQVQNSSPLGRVLHFAYQTNSNQFHLPLIRIDSVLCAPLFFAC